MQDGCNMQYAGLVLAVSVLSCWCWLAGWLAGWVLFAGALAAGCHTPDRRLVLNWSGLLA